MSNTIILKNYSNVFEEYIAQATITPGELLTFHTDGRVKPHNVPGGPVLKMFAVEDQLQGKGITDNYSAGDPVNVWLPGPGDEVYARLANGETAAIGSFLISDGNGELKVWEADSAGVVELSNSIVGQALEAKDSDTSILGLTNIKIKIL